MPRIRKISPCLWFDDQAEEAARFYTEIFENSRIVNISHYGHAGQEIHGRPPGSVMVVAFELDGHAFTALNGGPHFKFSEAISFEVHCDTQADIDYFWERLSEGGDERTQQCGWLKDRFGLSWQIVPAEMTSLMEGDPEAQDRVMTALLQMKKLDIEALRRAYAGETAAARG